ncbi:MAG TPA: hypothetical protein P5228_08655 [Bacteroidales bacterium]|nr:hypothetical protein [Bacteroidales bacterium]HRZ48531.1 hypothetical protein [Bacteroidales bacterium]
MAFPVEKVFIIGGTGFIGYHAALAFLGKGISVSSASMPDVRLDRSFPKGIRIVSDQFDVFTAEEKEIAGLLSGYDTLVYAVGPDDREPPDGPAYPFFYNKLVYQCVKVMNGARTAGVQRVVILNSYFSWFDRQPEFHGRLSNDHPYIRARVEQAQACIAAGAAGIMEVMILELPYIFGVMPGRIPIWKAVFLDRFTNMPLVLFPGGGTVAIHVKGVAEAIVASAINGVHGARYPIGDTNLKYCEIFRMMYAAIGVRKKIMALPPAIARFSGFFTGVVFALSRHRSGLNIGKILGSVLTKNLYLSEETIQWVRHELGFESLGYPKSPSAEDGIREAAQACFNEKNYP